MPKKSLWTIVACSVHLTIATRTCASSIYTATYTQIEQEFSTSRLASSLGLSSLVLGFAFGPLLIAPLSEYYGRRPIYLISWSFFIIWSIPSAVAKNIETLIITRFFQGFSGSSFLSVSGGTIADIFPKSQLQAPMVLVSLAPFVGPTSGPLIGGFINYYLHWRWTWYIITIWALTLLPAIIFCAPETFHPIRLRDKARKLRAETGDNRYWAPMERAATSKGKTVVLSLSRPFQLLLLEPMCLCLDLYSAVLLGILYLFFGIIPHVFRVNHDMNLWQSGLAFLGIIFGMIVAALTNPIWARLRQRLLKTRKVEAGEVGISEPEYQLPPAIAGAFLITIGLFWVAWTVQPGVHWMVPIVGSSFFGCG